MSIKYEKQNGFGQKLPWLEEWRFLANNHTTSLIDVINVKLTKNEESELNQLPVESKNEFINNEQVEQIITSSTFRAPFNNYPTVSSHQNLIATNFDIADQSAGLISIFGLSVSSEKLAYISVIILITALLIISSVLTVAVIVTSPQLKDIIGYYLISLAVSDLLCGTLITPISIYAVLDENWPTAYSEILCRIEVYIELVLLSVVLYIFMWISVDRYILLTRPGRYEAEQTSTRCKCWAMFTWVTSLVLCCPVLFNELQAQYDRYAFLCVLDCTKMMPYAITMALQMARGQQKLQSQQRNLKKQQEAKKGSAVDHKKAAQKGLIYQCAVCRSQMPDLKTYGQHFENKHPKSSKPPELLAEATNSSSAS
ncbi:Zinc finger protein [Trichinella papuae]|uniref:Zinc finger protein n=1 Tax=Trichinella papuae TaxID=268474 RepID=A0A0V1MYY5_9BILA|nr:Zinc finger protein [Trichinella papuae]